MKRGEIRWADLGPHRPQEQTGRRPVIVWQSDALNRVLQSVLVVPNPEEAMRPFDPAQGPLWRGSLLPLGEEDHGVLLTQHHIVSDGWSLSLLVREVVELYGAAVEARSPCLADLPIEGAESLLQ